MLKRRIFLWEAPIRIYHWVNVVLIAVLLITGFYIGKPVLAPASGEAYENFLMGNIRLWHALAAWFFMANFILRLYWAFAGNEYAKFKPWRKGFIVDGLDTVKYYLFLKKEHSLHTGHNVLAQLAYFFVIWIGSVFMIISGLAMQGEINPGGFQAGIAGWLIVLVGQSSPVRSYHHLVAWLFVAFIVVHLYMVIRQDILDDDGTVSSIINGYKFVIFHKEEKNDTQ